MLERTPPNATDIEQAILGAILMDSQALERVDGIIRASDFYLGTHRVIYECMIALYEQGSPVDVYLVCNTLRDAGRLEQAGGIAYVTALANSVGTAAGVAEYARIVREAAVRRQLITAGAEISDIAHDHESDINSVIERVESRVLGVTSLQRTSDLPSMRELLAASFETIATLSQGLNNGITGIETGLRELDKHTKGLQRPDLIYVGARPSMGKTAFALNIAYHAAVRNGQVVGFFSLEMSAQQITDRIVGIAAKLDWKNLDKQKPNFRDIQIHMNAIAKAPLVVDDKAGTLSEIRQRCRLIQRERGRLDMIIVDYIQLIRATKKSENRNGELSEISSGLKRLAKELNVPVVVLSQLNRDLEKRNDKRPILSDLRESGSLEQDADLVLFLYRDEYYNADTDKKHIVEVDIAKFRNGGVARLEFLFLPRFQRYAPKSFLNDLRGVS